MNTIYKSRRELDSQIAGIRSSRMALDLAKVRVGRKFISNLSYISNLGKDNGSGRCVEENKSRITLIRHTY